MLIWLTIRRGAIDPVCGMRVDRYATQHSATLEGRTYFFCGPGCRGEFESSPSAWVDVEAGNPVGAAP